MSLDAVDARAVLIDKAKLRYFCRCRGSLDIFQVVQDKLHIIRWFESTPLRLINDAGVSLRGAYLSTDCSCQYRRRY